MVNAQRIKIYLLLFSFVIFVAFAVTQVHKVTAQKSLTAFKRAPIDSAFLQEEILEAYRKGQRKVIVPKGTYRIPPADQSKTHHLVFDNLTDFEIDARGATFIMEDPRKGAILFQNCNNVTLRGATIDYAVLPFTQGTIEHMAQDGKWYDIRIDQGYPTYLDDPKYFPKELSGYIIDRKTLNFKKGTDDMYSAKVERLGNDLFRLHWRTPAKTNINVNDLMAFRGHFSHTIQLEECGGMEVTGVTILASTGFGIFEDNGDGGNRYTNIKITPGPKPAGAVRERILASAADGFHSNGVRKGPVVENCLFEKMTDDGVAVHGNYAMVMEADGNMVTVSTVWKNIFSEGDPLRFYDKNHRLVAEAVVKEVASSINYTPSKNLKIGVFEWRNYHRLMLDHKVEVEFGDFISTPNSNGSGYVIRNNTIRNNRARGILVKADNGLIEGNVLERNTMFGVLVTPETDSNEADYSHMLTIRNNTFKDTGWYNVPLQISGYDRAIEHDHIIISNNSFFSDQPKVNAIISSAKNVQFINNQFHFQNLQNQINLMKPVQLKDADNIRIEGNSINRVPMNMKGVQIKNNVKNVQGLE